MSVTVLPEKEIDWTPKLIKRLRGNRTHAEFALLIDVVSEDILLWENGESKPNAEQTKKLSELAEQEQFLKDWKLAGSGELIKDWEALEEPKRRFSQVDYQRGLEALERIRKLGEGLPPVDAVALIREIRDTDGRGGFQ